DGNQGSDTIIMGNGNDTFQWDPGDGNDTVDGGSGNDTVIVNGSAIAEIFDVSPNGSRVRLTRNIGSVVMDLSNIETVSLNALGTTETVTVNDLSRTDLKNVSVDLASTIGGSAGDATADTVIVNGTNADDIITATLVNGVLQVNSAASGAATVLVKHFD